MIGQPDHVEESAAVQTLLEQSEAAEALLMQPSAPASARAWYYAITAARTVKKDINLGRETWKRRIEPQLERPDRSDVIEVPRVRREDLSPAVLRAAMDAPTPVVFEGLIEDSEAVKTWSPGYFREHYGDVTVPMLVRWGDRNHVTVAEIIDGFDKHSGFEAPAVNNVTDLIMQNQELRDAIPFDLIRRWSGERLHGAQVFINAKEGGTSYHCANELNFFMMISGEKDWWLAHPRHSMWLEAVFDPQSGTYAFADFMRETSWDERPEGIPLMHAHLRPGDVLLNRPWWWHLVKNRTDAIGVATRWHRWGFRFGTQNPLFSSLQWLVPHQWGILWNDYVRGSELTDDKFVRAFLSHKAYYD